ncbi:MAG: metallophosphoesterase family protein [Bacteroidota bacterium]
MTRIGLLSDTHGFVNPTLFNFFKDCHTIWHTGDIGSTDVVDELKLIAPVAAVFGNIDDWEIRNLFPEFNIFQCEEVKVMLTHIGGYPPRYYPSIIKKLEEEKPALFACGHSHILKVMYDEKHSLLHVNPGAAGRQGMHHVSTAVRFIIDGKEIKELEILEMKKYAN